MLIILAEGSTKQPPRNILPREIAYGIVQNRTDLPLQEMNRELMMILKKKNFKLVNEDTTIRRNPDSTSGIYLIGVKV